MDYFSNIRGLWVVEKLNKNFEVINSLSIYSPEYTSSQKHIVNFTKNFKLNYLIHIAATSEKLLGDNLLRLVLVNEPHYTLFPNLIMAPRMHRVSNIDMMIPSLPHIRGKLSSTSSLVSYSDEFPGFWFTQLSFVKELETNFSLFYDLERKKFVLLEFHSKVKLTLKRFSLFHFSFNLNNSNGIGYISSEELVLATTVRISSYGWVSDQIHYSENQRGVDTYFFLLEGEILEMLDAKVKAEEEAKAQAEAALKRQKEYEEEQIKEYFERMEKELIQQQIQQQREWLFEEKKLSPH
jgi:hypothetical protein